MARSRSWRLTALTAALLAGGLLLAPGASASSAGSSVPVGLFGLPSLHSIIQAIAKGFFGALASALVPGWLKHGTLATIQHLVALPDPASWTHVSELQGEMTYLAAMLLPVTLAVGATRYWLVGLTGSAHPASAVLRCVAVSGVLVIYRWMVEQTVAVTNTITHGILGLPVVANGLQRIIGVLFGGALLSGAGGVFGAFLVIIGVVFAAGLFAAQVLLTVVLAVLIVAGPPLIALSAIPELSHLARSWADALLAIALVPIGWTVLFATAGALCLDATSFTGSGGALPGDVAAAFAGLITFVIAVRLPLMALGELRNLFSRQSLGAHAPGQAIGQMPGSERVRSAHARLRTIGLEGAPSLGASLGRAAGALGAPRGGPLGAARRALGADARRGARPSSAPAASSAGALAAREGARHSAGPRSRRGMRQRLAQARGILSSAPGEASAAIDRGSRRATRARAAPASGGAHARRTERSGSRAEAQRPDKAGKPSTTATRAGAPVGAARSASPGNRTERPRAAPRTPPAPDSPTRRTAPARVTPKPPGQARKPGGPASAVPSPSRPGGVHAAGTQPDTRHGTAKPPRTPAAKTTPPARSATSALRRQAAHTPRVAPAPAASKAKQRSSSAQRKPRGGSRQ